MDLTALLRDKQFAIVVVPEQSFIDTSMSVCGESIYFDVPSYLLRRNKKWFVFRCPPSDYRKETAKRKYSFF